MKVYAVRREDGKWFKSRKSGWQDWDCGEWVDQIDKAKIFTKVGSARSTVTWCSNNLTPNEVPELVSFDLVMCEVIDQTERVRKAKEEKQRKELEELQQRNLRKLEEARREYQSVKQKLRKLEQKV